jgi:hypothetical protein
MRPFNRNFFHFETVRLCEKKNFRIESPPLNLLQWKDDIGRVPAEGFETALSILKLQPQNYPKSQIENASKKLPAQRLPGGLEFRLEPA